MTSKKPDLIKLFRANKSEIKFPFHVKQQPLFGTGLNAEIKTKLTKQTGVELKYGGLDYKSFMSGKREGETALNR